MVLGSFPASPLGGDGAPVGLDPASLDVLLAIIEDGWGTGADAADHRAVVRRRRAHRRVLAAVRAGVGVAEAASNLFRWNRTINLVDVLPLISAPTLVLQREGSVTPNESVRDLAARIPGARYVEVPGDAVYPFLGDVDSIIDEIEGFLTGTRAPAPVTRTLATVLFTDMVGSTERASALGDQQWHDLLDAHHHEIRTMVDRFGGREVDTAGDGFLVTFDGPERAVARRARRRRRGAGRRGAHPGRAAHRRGDLVGRRRLGRRGPHRRARRRARPAATRCS